MLSKTTYAARLHVRVSSLRAQHKAWNAVAYETLRAARQRASPLHIDVRHCYGCYAPDETRPPVVDERLCTAAADAAPARRHSHCDDSTASRVALVAACLGRGDGSAAAEDVAVRAALDTIGAALHANGKRTMRAALGDAEVDGVVVVVRRSAPGRLVYCDVVDDMQSGDGTVRWCGGVVFAPSRAAVRIVTLDVTLLAAPAADADRWYPSAAPPTRLPLPAAVKEANGGAAAASVSFLAIPAAAASPPE